MSAATGNVTAQQLASRADDGNRYELVRGELRMMSPAGGRHGRIAHNLGLLLGMHVRQNSLGTVYAAETGFLLARNPDTVRAPDVAYISRDRLASLDDDSGYLPLAPDLVGEVISPSDTFSEVEEKALSWLAAGVRLVLLVDAQSQTLHAYRASDNIVVLREQDRLDASDVVPGWSVEVAELFR